jgi:dipeptidyl aminopeptidase/acylaminoacyl peptidase
MGLHKERNRDTIPAQRSESLMPTRRNLRLNLIPFALLWAAVCASAQDVPFTLEQVMSSPFPTDVVAAQRTGGFAWVFNARGARNIWVAEPPGFKGRQITNYTEDDGQDVGELAWTPDGKNIVYTRGGDFEFPERSYPNPAINPSGVEQDVWKVSVSGGAPLKLGEGHSPSVSPDGRQVAFIFKDQIWLAGIEGLAKAEQLLHSEGKASSLRWSPDGAQLAFVSRRTEHSLIGVYDLARETLRYLDPTVDRDMEPVWAPDSKRIAFLRIPASTEAFAFGPKRTGQPWSIHIAEVATGAGREVWRSEEGKGSVFREMVADNQILWAAGDLLIFPWERDGWTHLYSLPVAGGTAKLLTPGYFEVEDVSLTPGNRELIFNSNENDIDRRHIWREGIDGDHPIEVTKGEGIEWSPVMLADGRTLALLHSDARLPARPAVLNLSDTSSSTMPEAGRTLIALLRDVAPAAIPAEFPANRLVVPEQVIFSAADGLRIRGQLFLPKGATTGERHPAVVFFHGGSRREMLLGWHYRGYYHNAYAMNQYLASRGYVVLSVNYRTGIGYGLEFREALNYGATGASEFNDVQGAGLYLRSLPDVDPNRIGVWGGSYGGYLTALALARASNLFVAGVDMHGVHDWNLEIPNFAPEYDPRKQPEAARIAWESSPLASVSTWRSPVLLIQGDDDRNVPFVETIHLVEALRRQGVEFRQLVFPDEIHDFLRHSTWLRAYQAGADFFALHLRDHK